jgi:uncharacterized damage-inducible protein DinB
MGYTTAESLVWYFNLTHELIKMQLDGLTHADSLLQLPFRGNCLNWVLGHIVGNRNTALTRLGRERVWPEEDEARYCRGSEAIVESGQALPLEELLQALDETQEGILAALQGIDEAELDEVVDDKRTLGESLAWLHWHETYHVGQLEILRQLAGKDDVVIP